MTLKDLLNQLRKVEKDFLETKIIYMHLELKTTKHFSRDKKGRFCG